jgi:formylglycine-generating enzyme required for sulfatase activity
MKTFWLATLTALGVILGASSVYGQPRTRNCPAGTPRDREGYCIFARPGNPSPTPRAPRVSSTPSAPSTPRASSPRSSASSNAGPEVARASGRCGATQHDSGGHCCDYGFEWIHHEHACICLDPRICSAGMPQARGARPSSGPLVRGCPSGTVRIENGTFMMGSPESEGDTNEHPQIRVRLSAYCIDRTEVTVAAYRECVSAGICPSPPTTVNYPGYNASDVQYWSQHCNATRTDREDHPVNCVDWNHANTYCRWQGGRLPTEAEWEFAARGSDGRRYPWGNQAPDATRLNACGPECQTAIRRSGREQGVMFDQGDNFPSTSPVGSFPRGASPYGVMDMAGNVWEWTGDWYSDSYRTATNLGVVMNRLGPSEGTYRVFRGGGWMSDDITYARAAVRDRYVPSIRFNFVGFRCVRSPQ